MIIFGVDPGKRGAISALDAESGNLLGVFDMPSRYLMPRKVRKKESKYLKDGKTLRKKKPPLKQDTREVFDATAMKEFVSNLDTSSAVAVIEFVSARTGQGVSSTFTFGDYFGSIKTFFETLGIDYYLVMPKAWQTHFECLNESKADSDHHKKVIAEKCASVFPDAELYGPRGGLKDGRSDAILIADFFRETRSSDKWRVGTTQG